MTFTAAQVEQLLRPINPARVLRDGKGHSHVSQQDILAHLTRVFGFGGFDIDVVAAECVFEEPRVDSAGKPSGRFDCCYRSMVRLTVRDPSGEAVCHYENGSTGMAHNQARGDAHDLAYKSAISLSVKRAAIALGDGFGLSLYNKGQLTALVKATLVKPEGDSATDVQAGVEQQVSLGNDEVDLEPVAPPKGHMESILQAANNHAPSYDDVPDGVPDRMVAAPRPAPVVPKTPADWSREALRAACKQAGVDLATAVERFGRGSDGKPLKDTTDDKAIDALVAEYKKAVAA